MTWGVRRCYWYLGSIKMIAGKSGKWRHVADVAAHHPREVADRLLASGERVEVAHRRRLCSDRGSLKRRRDAAMAAPLALWDPRSNRLNHRRTSTRSTSCARSCGISTTARRSLGTTGRAFRLAAKCRENSVQRKYSVTKNLNEEAVVRVARQPNSPDVR